VLVVDTAAAQPSVVDAGCAPGVAATLDRKGTPAPPPLPAATSTTAAPTTAVATTPAATTTTEPRCSYVDADDAYPLRKCDRGPAVRAIQEQINKRGQTVDVDGYFGPATEQAVRNFQEAAGLEVDGLVGPDTWAALYTGEPAGTDADGNGTIEPWEIDAAAPPGDGDAASFVGLVFDVQMPGGTLHTTDGAAIPGLTTKGGWVIDFSETPPHFGGQYIDAGSGHQMLWLTRAEGHDPDGTLMPETVVAAIDVPAMGDGQNVEFGECSLDGAPDDSVAAITSGAGEGGQMQAAVAWVFDTAAGTITEIDAARVTCAVIGD
jgi:hypothetical protein